MWPGHLCSPRRTRLTSPPPLTHLSSTPHSYTTHTPRPPKVLPHTSLPPSIMMGLPINGHPLRTVPQLPVAKGTGTTVAAAPTWKRTLPAPSGITSPLEPLRCTVTHRGRVCLISGDTVEVVAWTPVLAQRTQLTPPPLLPQPTPTPNRPSWRGH